MALDRPGFRAYVTDDAHMRTYAAYQERYVSHLRESDRVLIDLVRERASGGASLLDVGCSTGNLLRHLRHAVPGLDPHGADIVEAIIASCRANPDLEGIDFHVIDMLEPPTERQYDIVTANAALMFFTPEEFARALMGLAALTAPGGDLVAFDYVHPFEQELEIVETSSAFPDGLRFFLRGEGSVREALAGAGFTDVSFAPFDIPVDLPRPQHASEIRTWTRRDTDGNGMSFRGTLYQPWCHVTAQREG